MKFRKAIKDTSPGGHDLVISGLVMLLIGLGLYFYAWLGMRSGQDLRILFAGLGTGFVLGGISCHFCAYLFWRERQWPCKR